MEVVVITGPDSGRRAAFSTALSVGRDAANDLVLSDPLVSGRHALLRVAATGRVEVTDLSSSNGTWVNGVAAIGATPVPPGTTVQVGNDLLEVVESRPAASGLDRLVSPDRAAPPQTPAPGPAALGGRPPTGPASISHAGPVAGGNVEISGRQAAGRDLHHHHHEGFRMKTRMSRRARRVLRSGLVLFVVGLTIALIGFGIYGAELVENIRDGFDSAGTSGGQDLDVDTRRLVVGIATMALGAALNAVGLLMMLVSLFMRRVQVRERTR